MKRNRLLVACLSLLLVLSIGYALFSEQVTVTGTIKGKGDFEVTPTCSAGYSDDLINAGVATNTDMVQKGFGVDSCDIVDGELKFTTQLDYPGAKRYFTVKVENTGTIPATFDEEKLSSKVLYDKIVQHVDAYIYGGVSSHGVGGFTYYNNNGEKTTTDIFKLIDVGVIESDNYCSYKDSCFNDFDSIKTGESIYYVLAFEWPEDYNRYSIYDDEEENIEYFVFHANMRISLQQIQLD